MNYLVEYQKSNNLTPDGIVGKKTAITMMKEFNILSMIQFCHFIAQIHHESAGFTASRENLSYSSKTLRKLFNKYFKPGEEYLFEHKPEKIANRVYANRNGNSNEQSGDGWKFRGGGSIQVTFKNNWENLFRELNLPINTPPDDVILKYYFKIADIYFDNNNIWKYCIDVSEKSILNVSRKINIGTINTDLIPNGYAERKALTLNYYKNLVIN